MEADEIIRQVFMHGAVIKAKMAWKDGVKKSAMAIGMIKDGSSIEETSEATGLSIDEINLLCNQI